MTKLGLTQSKYNASLYHRGDGTDHGAAPGGVEIGGKAKDNRQRCTGRSKGKISVLVHGDDFVAVGNRDGFGIQSGTSYEVYGKR